MPTPGQVIRMRLSPNDCMRVVDALRLLGYDPKVAGASGMSLSYAAKRVFESCLMALEREGTIPARDGFDYADIMSAFPTGAEANKVKPLQIKFAQRDFHEGYIPPPIVPDSPERMARLVRYEELIFKYQQDKANMDTAEMEELIGLVDEFQPAA